jgi:hypothetical protein
VPESSITCGLDDALSLIVTVPDFAPFVFGENVTPMVQLAPAARSRVEGTGQPQKNYRWNG